MIDPNATLFRETARFIDAVDREVEDANERKKDYYADIKEQISPEDFKALKDAIRERRRKRRDPDGFERHSGRVWQIVSILEAETDPEAEKTAVGPVFGPANGNNAEAAPTRVYARVAREEIHHDPETGEITERQQASVPHPGPAVQAAAENCAAPAAADPSQDGVRWSDDATPSDSASAAGSACNPVSAVTEFHDMPGFLVRKKLKWEAA